jgi:hypothetical protein
VGHFELCVDDLISMPATVMWRLLRDADASDGPVACGI